MSNCLELYIARVNVETENLQEARAKYLQHQPGIKALSALSRLGGSGRVLSQDSVRLYQNITHCLVAEKRKEAIWQWAEGKSPPGAYAITPDVSSASQQARWKQGLIRSTVEAQIHWTPNSDFTADALKTMIEKDETFSLKSKRLAFKRLISILTHSSATCQNVHLFEQFRSIARALFSAAEASQEYAAKLDLCHPTQPSADSFLEFLRNDCPDFEVHNKGFFGPKSLKAVEGVHTLVYRIVRVCLRESKRQNATWMLDFAYGH